uniref:Cupin 2 conserved barrel domain protein n=1 Tax=Burkholderia sp. (strain CCGE1003) TaxID=640512 RepID=E1T8J8_BURSG
MKLHTLMVAATLAGAGMFATSPPAWAADAAAHESHESHETVTPAFAEAIANVPGKKMTALVVDYAPGGKSSPHRHGQAFVVAYVLSGSIRSGVDGGEPHVFHAGEHWVEKPGAHHTVSENASDTEPARLLAIFVADRNDNKLVTFDHQ